MTPRRRPTAADRERWDPETRAVLTAALEVALDAPVRQGKHVPTAKVGWYAIHELREAFDALGIDWRKAKAVHDEQKAEARSAAYDARREAAS